MALGDSETFKIHNSTAKIHNMLLGSRFAFLDFSHRLYIPHTPTPPAAILQDCVTLVAE